MSVITSKTIRTAAKLIDKCGLAKWVRYEGGKYCFLGAIGQAHEGDPHFRWRGNLSNEWSDQLDLALERALERRGYTDHEDYEEPFMRAVCYNNAAETKKKDVVKLLEVFAEELDALG